jgi:hypothetical protein
VLRSYNLEYSLKLVWIGILIVPTFMGMFVIFHVCFTYSIISSLLHTLPFYKSIFRHGLNFQLLEELDSLCAWLFHNVENCESWRGRSNLDICSWSTHDMSLSDLWKLAFSTFCKNGIRPCVFLSNFVT